MRTEESGRSGLNDDRIDEVSSVGSNANAFATVNFPPVFTETLLEDTLLEDTLLEPALVERALRTEAACAEAAMFTEVMSDVARVASTIETGSSTADDADFGRARDSLMAAQFDGREFEGRNFMAAIAAMAKAWCSENARESVFQSAHSSSRSIGFPGIV